jgi:hypothetical protein
MSTLIPFDVFLAETASARPEQYAEALEAGAAFAHITPEAGRAEFEKIKDYILGYYKDVQPLGSFLDANGQTIDCIPFEQQPSVRAARAEGLVVARTAPDPPQLEGMPSLGPRPQPIQPKPLCPAGAVPIVRLTLDRLLRWGTLDNYFRKIPVGSPGAEESTTLQG